MTIVVTAGLAGSQPLSAQAGHASTLAHATASATSPSQLIVTFVATGDLPGLVTLAIDRDPATGAAKGGTWSLVVAYVRDVPVLAPTGSSAPGDDPDAGIGLEMVNRGTLAGTFEGGAVPLDADGTFAGFTSSQLLVTHGSVTFAGATGGGSIAATKAGDSTTGTLALNF